MKFVPLLGTAAIALAAAALVSFPIAYPKATLGPIGLQIIVGIALFLQVFFVYHAPQAKV